MSGPATILREIHQLQRHEKELRDQIDRLPRQLKVQQAKVTRQEDLAREAQEALKHLKVAVHDKESQLKQLQQQIAKHQKQLNEAASKKEYDALKVEMAGDKEKCQQFEDAILAGMIEVDEKSTQVPELAKAVQRAKDELAQFEKDSVSRQASLQEQLRQTQRALQEVEATLLPDVRATYDRLASARGADALATAQSRTCLACNTEMTIQSYNDLLSARLVICKACGRILYLPE